MSDDEKRAAERQILLLAIFFALQGNTVQTSVISVCHFQRKANAKQAACKLGQ